MASVFSGFCVGSELRLVNAFADPFSEFSKWRVLLNFGWTHAPLLDPKMENAACKRTRQYLSTAVC